MVTEQKHSDSAQTPSESEVALLLPNGLQKRRTVVGEVVSDKMQKTIVVKVDRQVRHALYKKYVEKTRRYKAHDEKNDAKIGDRVTLVESRPMSREKRWVLQSIIRRAGQAPEANV
jgi:small subunit ribosomal protein S17